VPVRIAEPADLAGLLALYALLNPDDPPLDHDIAQFTLAQIRHTPGMTLFVLEHEATLAATCTLIVIPNLTRGARPYALIENVVTDATHRTKGLGRTIIQAAITAAWAAGCYKIMLMTGSKRPETLRFYANLGFAQNKTGFQMRRPGEHVIA
jgi:GNAT superfamily N-acetyltransferase